jgi:dipeptidyl aminopeptidase/acylaminoacyl peptidase
MARFNGSSRVRRFLSCCMPLWCLIAGAAASAATLESYGRLPRYEGVVLSPDGSRVAFIRTEGNSRTVAVTDLAGGAMVGRLRAGDQKLRDVAWVDDDRLLILTSVTGEPMSYPGPPGEMYQLQIYEPKSGKTFLVPQPNSFGDVSLLNIVAGSATARRIEDHTILFVPGYEVMGNPLRHGLGRRTVHALIRVDLESNTSRILQPGRFNIGESWVIDDAGNVAAAEAYDGQLHHWSIALRRDGRMQEVLSGNEAIDYPRILGLGPSADTVLLQQVEEGDLVWRTLSMKDGSLGSPLADKAALNHPIESWRTHRLVGGLHAADDEYRFLDPEIEKSWQGVLRAFPDERVYFESASADFRKMVIVVEGAKHGYSFELVDLDTHRAEPLGDVYEGITQPYEVRRVSYAAGDGLPLEGYLTLPRKPATNLPLIVLPHAAPGGRASAHFDWLSQALADQGYAVLQPNYRGSDLGWSFITKGFGEWGRKMQSDLSDGVHYLVHEGIADPARVCIVGSSYGGYAALAGVTLQSGIYKCAVSFAGISDIGRWLAWVNDQHHGRGSASERYWDRFMGVSGPSDPLAGTISPLQHADAVAVPVLLIHGTDDTGVPFEQSRAMYEALKAAKKDVQLETLKGEDHWLTRSETRLQMLESTVAFLRANNPP